MTAQEIRNRWDENHLDEERRTMCKVPKSNSNSPTRVPFTEMTDVAHGIIFEYEGKLYIRTFNAEFRQFLGGLWEMRNLFGKGKFFIKKIGEHEYVGEIHGYHHSPPRGVETIPFSHITGTESTEVLAMYQCVLYIEERIFLEPM